MKKIGAFLYQTFLLFAFLGVFFVPFTFSFFSLQTKITKFIFEDLIFFISSNFNVFSIVNPEISSDSTTLYILFLVLFIFAFIAVISLSFINLWKKQQDNIFKIIQLILNYYLAIIMFKYGFDKIFKVQFYLPEPNTLYTPLGMLDKDIAFWSIMGSSYSYNIFMGFAEVIPALMLLYNKTRTLGLFILSGILLNIIFINISFDISVKLYSSFLFFLCLLILTPNFKRLFDFFVLNKHTILTPLNGNQIFSSKITKLIFKTVILFFFFIETLYPYLQKAEFNDDNTARPALHGAYEIIKMENTNSSNLKIKRFFIHRQNYFIFQYEDDTTEDFYLELNPSLKKITLTDYDGNKTILLYNYSIKTKILKLQSTDLKTIIYSKPLPWKNLPLLQPLFHWTVDEI